MTTKTEATIDDLYRVPENGKAEIVNGELVLMSPTGGVPGRTAGKIYRSLDDYERSVGGGYAFPDNVGFIVNLPNRRSFSPNAAFFKGELRGGLFLEGAPVFAVEVRSTDDYGPAAEKKMAQKRADYFAAGTLVVWDVDVLREKLVRAYRADVPDSPQVYCSEDIANAEPALPGWMVSVSDLWS
ncbi:MAG TPA: Uma2 family endonuclease [Pyrinomonadaceae bacterium]|nr:Uma2 family endonuclease [Pyrinomonadaceae bacterium]